MKAQINELMFKKILKATSTSVSRDETRPILTYIKIDIYEGQIKAFSCDGYRMTKIVINGAISCDEFFSVLIKPFPFKTTRLGVFDVEITLEGREAFIKFNNENGGLQYRFIQPEAEYPLKLEDILQGHRPGLDRKSHLQASFLAAAAKTVWEVSSNGRCAVTVNTSADPTKPILLDSSSDDGVRLEQLILPVRVL